MHFKQFLETGIFAATPEERRAIEALKLMASKYPPEEWNAQSPAVMRYIDYVGRRVKQPINPSKAQEALQDWINITHMRPYPDQDRLEVTYEQSGLFHILDGDIPPFQRDTFQVVQRGLAAIIRGETIPIKRASIQRTT